MGTKTGAIGVTLRIVDTQEFQLPTRTKPGDIWEIGPFSLVCAVNLYSLRQYDLWLAQLEMVLGKRAELRDSFSGGDLVYG